MLFLTQVFGFTHAELEGATTFVVVTACTMVALLVALVSKRVGHRFANTIEIVTAHIFGYWAVATSLGFALMLLAIVSGVCERHDPDGYENDHTTTTCSEPAPRTVGGHARHFVELSGNAAGLIPVTIGSSVYTVYKIATFEPPPPSP